MSEKPNPPVKLTYWSETPGSIPVPITSRVNFPQLEHDVLALWDNKNIFRRTISEREGCPDFVAYDGPPGTNGQPHIGHMMQSALKDLWPRYKTMRGFRVLRKAGWDTHGLPIEQTAERELGLKNKQEIIDFGVEKYIDYCRQTVFRYKDKWISAIRRIGRFLDTENDYATLMPNYIQTDWWVLKQAWDKGILYQGYKIMPYSPLSGMTLSSHEVAQGYKDITDISLFVKFPVMGQEKTFLVAWTTTAWTLLSNVALAVNPDLIYVTVLKDGEKLILAEARLEAVAGFLKEYTIIDKRPGRELEGLRYRPLWSFLEGVGENAHQVAVDNYVTADDGSGIVHLALYGEDDYRIIKRMELPFVQNVDSTGHCVANTGVYAGRYFREEGLDVDILKDLALRGLLFGKEKIVHSYPHNYKSGEPLMYFAKSAWFLRTSAIKEAMIAANKQINWLPEHIRDGRFGNWLENNVDWAVSRERFWGTPLPVWTCEGCGERVCVGSYKELGELRGKPLPADFDPHKPHIDKITLPCKKCGATMRREPEVMDCWFDAGIMPWGQWGYPGEEGSKKLFDTQYPADFICEAIDQTRGWFYTMLAPAVMLTGKSSYKNVICTELILDEQGQKMSKSRGNVVDPMQMCEKYSADAVRWNFYCVNPWTVRRFKESDIADSLKQVIIPYWNAYSFFITYARVDNWKLDLSLPKSDKLLDRWILSRIEWLQGEVENSLDRYDVTSAANAITTFVDELTNWYIRRSRRRFWKSEDDSDKQLAYNTLYTVLKRFNRLLAPFMPFLSEAIYQNLDRVYESESADSIHLTDWYKREDHHSEPAIEQEMHRVQEIVSIARSLRNEGGTRVRQPLREVAVAGLDIRLSDELVDLILDELNVRRLSVVSSSGSLRTLSAKGDFKTLGPRFGAKAKEISAKIASLDTTTLAQLLEKGGLIELAGENIGRADMLIIETPIEGYWARTDGKLTVAVDYRVDEELKSEWLAREFVHHIQNMRRDADLDVTQRIVVQYDGSEELQKAVLKHSGYISTETLASSITLNIQMTGSTDLKIGDQVGRITLQSD